MTRDGDSRDESKKKTNKAYAYGGGDNLELGFQFGLGCLVRNDPHNMLRRGTTENRGLQILHLLSPPLSAVSAAEIVMPEWDY